MVLLYIVVFSLSLLLAFIALAGSHFLSLNFLNIFTFFKQLISGVNWLYFGLSLFLFSVFFGVVFYYILRKEKKNYLELYPLLIFSVFLFVVLGSSLLSFISSFVSILIALWVYYSYFSKKEIYKEIPYEKLVYGATKTFLTYLFLTVSILLSYYVYSHPSEMKQDINNFMASTSGINITDINNMRAQIEQQQYQQTYSLAKQVEQYVLYSIYENNNLQGEEKYKCLKAVNSSISSFDGKLRESLMKEPMNSEAMEGVHRLEKIVSVLYVTYPLLLFLSLFFTLQLFNYVVSVISYLVASFLKAFYNE